MSPSGLTICLATCEPEAPWLVHQLETIRAQTHRDWHCLISDDASGPTASAGLLAAIDGDPRFELTRQPLRLGFYRNFEALLELARDRSAPLVALADQDDAWYPDKLARLAAGLAAAPDSQLAYSDFRQVDEAGGIIASTFWQQRRDHPADIVSLLVANSVTGAATLLRRELLDSALPFPGLPGTAYHDHWLALCARALGPLTRIEAATYDRLIHPESVTARDRVARETRPDGRQAFEVHYARAAALATELLARYPDRLDPGSRRRLGRILVAPRSNRSLAWLAARSLRPLIGHNETKGIERRLVRAILWHRRFGLAPK